MNQIRRQHSIPPTCHERYLDLLPPSAEALREAGIVFAGISRLRAGYHIGNPSPASAHMIILTDRGQGRLLTPEVAWELTAGDSLVGPVGHAYEFFTVEDCWDISWFYLEDSPVWRGLKGPVRRFRDVETLPVTEAMEGFLRECTRTTGETLACAYAQLTARLLERLLSGVQTPETDEEGSALERLWQRVRRAPHLAWNTPELASAAGMSVSTLQRQTKRRWGCSPYKIVIRLRMEQACLLLRSSDYPVKLIAERVGYADEFIFSAAFRRWSGHSPSAWRRRG